MNFIRDGSNMAQPAPVPGSIKRARERARAGLPREDPSQGLGPLHTVEEPGPQVTQPPADARRPFAGASAGGPTQIPRPMMNAGGQSRGGQSAITISRPTQVPQWPLAGPVPSPVSTSNSQPYRPPAGRSQPPPRPERPSRVPSILDGSRIQDYTPVFQYQPMQAPREPSRQDLVPIPETPSSYSRASIDSSEASIPDFPVPSQMGMPGNRRSITLGPPPSSRRGASSFYSTVSYVSPIPEESPRTRSHTSFASSAAMPDSWEDITPAPSPQYPETSFDEPILEESNPFDDNAEESQLVRSASLGKRGRPVLVSTSPPRETSLEESRRPDPHPVQRDAVVDGTGFIEASTSSSGTLPTIKTIAPPPQALTRDSFIEAYNAASATDPANPRGTPSPQPQASRSYSRLSAIRRPPKLDIGAVRTAESRGSLTSLPDLIRRATRLAASLEEGKRPASRLNDLTSFGRFGDDVDRKYSYDGEKHQSGLSDMLAAFPPPAQASNRRSFRESLRQQVSWPLPLTTRGQANSDSPSYNPSDPEKRPKGRRRCCGLPCWAFLLLLFIVLCLVAAAVVLPLEFLVFKKNRDNAGAEGSLQQCQAQLTCLNGGTNVVNNGVCSCICTNGFMGTDCSVAGADGCTTTALAGDTNISNVTLGDAIPRLIQQAQTNFSVPLSPTIISAKLNAGNLSCSAENALVTFDGLSTRQGDAGTEVTAPIDTANELLIEQPLDGVSYVTTTITKSTTATNELAGPPQSPTPLVDKLDRRNGFTTVITAVAPTSVSLVFSDTLTISMPTAPTPSTPTITRTVTAPSTTDTTAPTNVPSNFTITEEVLDFARVAVLFILQEDNLDSAEAAQIALQRLFTSAGQAKIDSSKAVTVDQVRNLTLGHRNSVDLVNKRVDAGGNLVGGSVSSTEQH